MTNNDVDALQLLLADDLHYVHSNGVVEGKAEFLRKITSGERRFRSFRGVERNARREGGFTFVFGDAEVQVDRAAGFLKNRIPYTAIYRNDRSEEHTSELQSQMRRAYGVFCLKKKTTRRYYMTRTIIDMRT